MKNNEEYKPNKPSTIAYDYLFNYFGRDTFKDKTIVGAAIQLAIRVFKNGKEIKFSEEIKVGKMCLCDAYEVSFDREQLFTITKVAEIEKRLYRACEWEHIEAEVVGYTLDYLVELSEKERKELPEMFRKLPCSTPMEVTEEEFKEFLRGHLDDFDIADNIHAQVPSVSFV